MLANLQVEPGLSAACPIPSEEKRVFYTCCSQSSDQCEASALLQGLTDVEVRWWPKWLQPDQALFERENTDPCTSLFGNAEDHLTCLLMNREVPLGGVTLRRNSPAGLISFELVAPAPPRGTTGIGGRVGAGGTLAARERVSTRWAHVPRVADVWLQLTPLQHAAKRSPPKQEVPLRAEMFQG